MTVRMFLNAIFDFKAKDKAFATVPPVLREVLKENGWMPERLLLTCMTSMRPPRRGTPPMPC